MASTYLEVSLTLQSTGVTQYLNTQDIYFMSLDPVSGTKSLISYDDGSGIVKKAVFNETPSTVVSTAGTLIPVTVNGVTLWINCIWIRFIVANGSGSNIGYFFNRGVADEIQATESASAVQALVAATIGSGTGTVTSFSFVNANGFTGTVATATTTPALTVTGFSPVKTNVTQITSTTTGVTDNTQAGIITTFTQTLAASSALTFTVTNSTVTTASVILVKVNNYAGAYATNGFPIAQVNNVTSGSFDIVISNTHATNALSGVLKIGFMVE